jgi:tRNA (guanine37-N1)-methyltransferase
LGFDRGGSFDSQTGETAMRIDILTLFPQMFESPLSCSILKRARDKAAVEIILTNIRDFAVDKYKKVDDKPYGGGAGMVMMPGPVFACFEFVQQLFSEKGRVILLTPQGQPFNQSKAVELSKEERLILISGRYEGFDERIRVGLNAEQISIGDYVLSGGELAAMVIVDAVVRLLPGVLGDEQSARDDSFENGLLEYPQYTRPEVFRDMKVPEVLLTGDHAKIAEWRRRQALERTRKWRPDLLPENKSTASEGF